jgi:peptide-methionine (S)-S-oxide reductase
MKLYDLITNRSARRIEDLPPVVVGNSATDLDTSATEESGPSTSQSEHQLATLGAGCFWCLDAIARRSPGIISSVVGYGGGTGPAPTYNELHHSNSGYIETVQLEFDPEVISFREVLDLFFRSHDPTTANQDGANRGPEYHSTIFYHSDEQRTVAEAAVDFYESAIGRPIITSLCPFTTFFPAETEHQDFFNSNPTHPYCTFVVMPKLAKVLKE